MANASIYTLEDPGSGGVRYVGWTSRSLLERFCEHLSEARRGGRYHRACWIRLLLSNDSEPTIRLRAIVPIADGPEAERLLIRGFRREGFRLVNTTDGGEGTRGYKYTEEDRRRMSLAHAGKKLGPMSEKARAAHSRSMMGKKKSEEHCAKMSIAQIGKKRTPETKAKMSARQKGRKLSPEWRANISAGHQRRNAARRAGVLIV